MIYGTLYETIISKYTHETPYENPLTIITTYQIQKIHFGFRKEACSKKEVKKIYIQLENLCARVLSL